MITSAVHDHECTAPREAPSVRPGSAYPMSQGSPGVVGGSTTVAPVSEPRCGASPAVAAESRCAPLARDRAFGEPGGQLFGPRTPYIRPAPRDRHLPPCPFRRPSSRGHAGHRLSAPTGASVAREVHGLAPRYGADATEDEWNSPTISQTSPEGPVAERGIRASGHRSGKQARTTVMGKGARSDEGNGGGGTGDGSGGCPRGVPRIRPRPPGWGAECRTGPTPGAALRCIG